MRDTDKDRIAQLEEERDKLLREVRELRARLAKIESTQDLRQALDQLQQAENKESADLLKAKRLADEKNARLGTRPLESFPRRPATPPTSAQKTLPVTPPSDMRDYVDELSARIRQLEDERARAIDPTRSGVKKVEARAVEIKLRKLEEERAKVASGTGNRVEELEARMKQMDVTLQKLLVEIERLRK